MACSRCHRCSLSVPCEAGEHRCWSIPSHACGLGTQCDLLYLTVLLPHFLFFRFDVLVTVHPYDPLLARWNGQRNPTDRAILGPQYLRLAYRGACRKDKVLGLIRASAIRYLMRLRSWVVHHGPTGKSFMHLRSDPTTSKENAVKSP